LSRRESSDHYRPLGDHVHHNHDDLTEFNPNNNDNCRPVR
jgi:hypothetical protein